MTRTTFTILIRILEYEAVCPLYTIRTFFNTIGAIFKMKAFGTMIWSLYKKKKHKISTFLFQFGDSPRASKKHQVGVIFDIGCTTHIALRLMSGVFTRADQCYTLLDVICISFHPCKTFMGTCIASAQCCH